RIYFIITNGLSTTLGSNIEPLPSINDMLNTIPYRSYQQCIPYISLNILLQLKLCIPFNEISLWINLITKAVSAATGNKKKNIFFSIISMFFFFQEQSNVHIMLK